MKTHLSVPECLLWTALLLGCPSPIWSQSATTGALSGTIRNAAGDPLPGVSVTLTDAATSQVQTSLTGHDGAYRFALLAPSVVTGRAAASRVTFTEISPFV